MREIAKSSDFDKREKKVLILISVELGKVSQALSRLVVIAKREREREREGQRGSFGFNS